MKIAIWGFGVTGKAILEYFVDKGHEIHVYDSGDNFDVKEYDNVTYNFGVNEIDNIESYDMLFISPGISKNTETVKKAYESGVRVYNDVSYFVEKVRGKAKLIGVTGSNGKSTTVSLLQHVLSGLGKKSILVGNIGVSPMKYLDGAERNEFEYVVLELSSWQLEIFNEDQYVDIGVFTNLTPNHLDRHEGDMQVYANEKLNMFSDDSILITTPSDSGIAKYVLPNVKDFVGVSLEDLDERYFSDEIFLKGDHNRWNIAYVLKVLELLNISDDVFEIVKSFKGLEHRVEFVREVEGVKWYNDSKSTSPEATITALNALGDVNNIILIAGGTDKGVGYSSWTDPLNLYVKHMIILDHDINDKLINVCEKSNTEYTVVPNIIEAVRLSSEISNSGDTVLLSPGSASFGMFENFEDRGRKYKEEVNGV